MQPQEQTPLQAPIQAPAPMPQNPFAPENNPNDTYESNPFAISFNGMELLAKHAKTVFIATAALGLLGAVTSTVSEIIWPSSQEFEFSTDSSPETTLDSEKTEAPESVNEFFSDFDASNIDPILIASIVGALIFAGLIFALAIAIFNALYFGIIGAGTVAASQHRDISLGQAFSEMTSRFGTLFIASIIAGFKIFIGYVFFIIPGIRAQLRYAALPYIIMDRKELSASQAIEESKRLYDGHLLESYGITFVGGIIPIIGPIIGACGLTLSQRQIRAYKDSNLPKPPLSKVNYIGYIVFALILLIVVFGGIGLLILLRS